ncbi:MAG: hypothetical protein Q4B70_00760 [Lachnospiraceae bacterium]|nr:hypothetical protein [Lachnospiraceae bacterium]
MTAEMNQDNVKIEMPEQEQMEMPGVEELLKILIDLNMSQSQQSVSLLMNYMNDVEENFFSVLQELDAVKEQLANIQNTPQTKETRHTLSEMAGQMGARLTSLQEQMNGYRQALNEKATQLVQNFKERGFEALNNVCGFLGIKDIMAQMKESLLIHAEHMQASMDKIDKVSQELREASTHAKNVGRAMTGKEALEVPEGKESGFFHQMKRPYQSMKNFCEKQTEKLEKGIAHMEHMEQTADRSTQKRIEQKSEDKKPSIMEKLQDLKGKQESQAKATPMAEKVKTQENAL